MTRQVTVIYDDTRRPGREIAAITGNKSFGLYLSGMEIYDIMKITGHTSPLMLKRYIKADELEVVQKIVEKYDYFN